MEDFVGAGIGFRQPYRRELLVDDDGVKPALLEIVPSHFFAEPELLQPLAERYPLVFHEVICSVGTAGVVDEGAIRRIRDLCRHGQPILFTEHLALTHSPDGTNLGHLAPIWYTRDALDGIADRVRRWQDLLDLEVALEAITAPFVIPYADYEEADFFGELVERTGCSLLLDLTNQAINGHNLGFDPFERLASYPLHAVRHCHLAGGELGSDTWIDSHSTPVDDLSYALLAKLRGRAPLRSLIIERDRDLPPLDDLVAESERADRIWRGRDPAPSINFE